MAAGARLFFVSSTASVASSPAEVVLETLSLDPADSSPVGYARSKWVAENICAAAYRAQSGTGSSVPSPVSVLRVGQLCGNVMGVWNKSEAYPLMLSTARMVGYLPDLGDTPLDWLPVDKAAKIVCEIALRQASVNGTGAQAELPADAVPVYHLINPNKTPTWREMLQWLSEDSEDVRFQVCPPSEWVERLETALGQGEARHPSHGLLGFWKHTMSQKAPKDDGSAIYKGSKGDSKGPNFDISRAQRASREAAVRPLDREALLRMWHWIRDNV
jgi:thioester reductase-like protein